MGKSTRKVVDFVIQEITNRTGTCPISSIDAIKIAELVDREFIVHEVT